MESATPTPPQASERDAAAPIYAYRSLRRPTKPRRARSILFVLGATLSAALIVAVVAASTYGDGAADRAAQEEFYSAVHELALAEISETASRVNLMNAYAEVAAQSARLRVLLSAEPALLDAVSTHTLESVLHAAPVGSESVELGIFDPSASGAGVASPVSAPSVKRIIPAGAPRAEYTSTTTAIKIVLGTLSDTTRAAESHRHFVDTFAADSLNAFVAGVQQSAVGTTYALLQSAPLADQISRDRAGVTLVALEDAAKTETAEVFAAAEAHHAAVAAVWTSHQTLHRQQANEAG